ncbi:ROK family transcriptional regulator [Kibdelosporangium philippinense]|uniref:ROK family transcriptional regulator n=1 Tax=Kibdelosporangium philippinense TaxID=211113 RepID=A0ABS8ZST1_9PSEU|nr:ROK family transcriptional regulator [Kibdelosporangium philippinense]MCE7010761.1 ROK family transcriptional regulator [Kibdelosporangium philippinense]
MVATSAPSDGRLASSAAAVLRAVLRNGPVPRRTLSRLTGLSGAAVSRHCTRLAELGLITETSAIQRVGRPHVPVDIDVSSHRVAGVHVAHEFCTIVVLDLRCRVLAQRRVPHVSDDPVKVLTNAAEKLTSLVLEVIPGQAPLSLGVATGGWVDQDAGVMVEHASLGWRDVPLRDVFARRLGLPVHVDNHTRALMHAEELFGAVGDRDSVLHLFVGNVVDAAVRMGGQTLRGKRSAAGDIAHLPVGAPDIRCREGHFGCFEATVADQAWSQRVSGRSFWDLLAAAESGDALARKHLVNRSRIIGRAAALLYDLVNPDLLVVAELGANSFPECLAAIRAEVGTRSRAPEDTVQASSFGSATVLAVSAGAAALDVLYGNPLAASFAPVSHPVGAT